MKQLFKRGGVYALPFVAVLLLMGCGDENGGENTCDPSADAPCSEGHVCVMSPGNEEFTCQPSCDPKAVDPCEGDLVCNPLEGGGFGCFYPVHFMGNIYDSVTEEGIEGANVVAADEGGLVITDVAISDADGNYDLIVPATRDASGTPLPATYTLRVAAQGYQPYPYGLRPAIPVDTPQTPVLSEDHYTVQNLTTDVALIELASTQGLGSIEGTIEPEGPMGALVVAEEGPLTPGPYAFADRDGRFVIFNVPGGQYTVRAYKAGLQALPEDVTVAENEPLDGVVLAGSEDPLGSVTGQISIVNAPGNAATSVVLIPESTFMETFVRGIVPPGLRAPTPGEAPSITGEFEILDVPTGDYVVLAAFENDGLVRDPDPGIAGTQIVHISVPDTQGSPDIAIDTAFKVTEALPTIGPGADGPEAIESGTAPTFIWGDDSSETHYSIMVHNVFGELVWEVPDVPSVQGSETVEVLYEGPALAPGMYYQWRVTSHRASGPISLTEDLKGVFYVPSSVQ